jgi:hypothetical protein
MILTLFRDRWTFLILFRENFFRSKMFRETKKVENPWYSLKWDNTDQFTKLPETTMPPDQFVNMSGQIYGRE